VIAWQSQIHRARSKIANIFFVFRVGFSEVFGLSEVASSNLAVRQGYLIETRQVTAISASIESAAAYSSIKAAAKFASKHQRRSPAHVTLYPDAVATFCKRNPVDDGKQSRRRATETISQRRSTCERNVSNNARLEGIQHLSSSRINYVRNKVKKTIVSVAKFPSLRPLRTRVHICIQDGRLEATILKRQRATIKT